MPLSTIVAPSVGTTGGGGPGSLAGTGLVDAGGGEPAVHAIIPANAMTTPAARSFTDHSTAAARRAVDQDSCRTVTGLIRDARREARNTVAAVAPPPTISAPK